MLGGLREVVLSFKFRQNRVNRFRAVGGRNLPFPIPKASGLYNGLYTSRDDDLQKNPMDSIHKSLNKFKTHMFADELAAATLCLKKQVEGMHIIPHNFRRN